MVALEEDILTKGGCVKGVKTWHVHRLDTSRHPGMDGEKVGIFDMFSNGLHFPGEPKGPPHEYVNCHCHMTVEWEKLTKSECDEIRTKHMGPSLKPHFHPHIGPFVDGKDLGHSPDEYFESVAKPKTISNAPETGQMVISLNAAKQSLENQALASEAKIQEYKKQGIALENWARKRWPSGQKWLASHTPAFIVHQEIRDFHREVRRPSGNWSVQHTEIPQGMGSWFDVASMPTEEAARIRSRDLSNEEISEFDQAASKYRVSHENYRLETKKLQKLNDQIQKLADSSAVKIRHQAAPWVRAKGQWNHLYNERLKLKWRPHGLTQKEWTDKLGDLQAKMDELDALTGGLHELISSKPPAAHEGLPWSMDHDSYEQAWIAWRQEMAISSGARQAKTDVFDEEESWRFYTSSGYNHYAHYLRGTTGKTGYVPPGWNTPEERERMRQRVESLDKLMAKGIVQHDTVTYRGVTGDFKKLLKEGFEWDDKSYVSVSTDKSQAKNFGGEGGVIKLVVPAGTHAAMGYRSEKEFILPRDGSYKIIGYDPGEKVWVAEIEPGLVFTPEDQAAIEGESITADELKAWFEIETKTLVPWLGVHYHPHGGHHKLPGNWVGPIPVGVEMPDGSVTRSPGHTGGTPPVAQTPDVPLEVPELEMPEVTPKQEPELLNLPNVPQGDKTPIKFDGSFRPQLVAPNKVPPDDASFQFEQKFDGQRAVIKIGGDGTVKIQSRTGQDITDQFPEFKDLPAQLNAQLGQSYILDGEIISKNPDGTHSIENMEQRRANGAKLSDYPVTFVAFDLLEFEGDSKIATPLEGRRKLLEKVVPEGEDGLIQRTKIYTNGQELLDATKASGGEGIVAKKKGSLYQPGKRSREWLKVKYTKQAEVVIVGWTDGKGEAKGFFGSLLGAVYGDDGQLHYVGNVGGGMVKEDRQKLMDLLHQNGRDDKVLEDPEAPRNYHPVSPNIVITAEFLNMTDTGKMRQPSIVMVRHDKNPEDVTQQDLDEVNTPPTTGVKDDVPKGYRHEYDRFKSLGAPTPENADEWSLIYQHLKQGADRHSSRKSKLLEKVVAEATDKLLSRDLEFDSLPIQEAQLHALFDQDIPNTDTRSIIREIKVFPKIEGASDIITVDGAILSEKGAQIGVWSRSLIRNAQTGDLRVSNVALKINSSDQGQGIATNFNNMAFDQYRSWGVKAVHLHANIDVGGYAWAVRGFDWDPEGSNPYESEGLSYGEGQAARFIRKIEFIIRKETDPGDPIRQELRDLEAMDLKDIHPWTIAKFGISHPHGPAKAPNAPAEGSWIGKDVLMGDSWYGELRLGESVTADPLEGWDNNVTASDRYASLRQQTVLERQLFLDSLAEEQRRKAVELDSRHLTELNSDLRNGVARTDDMQATADSLIEAGVPLENDTVLYRGISGDIPLEIGSTFTDKGYTFVSDDPGVAAGFSDGEDIQVLAKIKFPAGTKQFRGNYELYLEHVMGRGYTFKITGVETRMVSQAGAAVLTRNSLRYGKNVKVVTMEIVGGNGELG